MHPNYAHPPQRWTDEDTRILERVFVEPITVRTYLRGIWGEDEQDITMDWSSIMQDWRDAEVMNQLTRIKQPPSAKLVLIATGGYEYR